MESYKFIAWADIHHDELGAKCITIEDTVALERIIFQRAKEGNFDFTLFPGDRYLKREPKDKTKVMADKVIDDLVVPGNIPHYHLVGNHDWVDNTMKWHTAESLKGKNNVVVMDESKTYQFGNVLIHALPADFEFSKENYSLDPRFFNLFVFHDAVRGCKLSDTNEQRYEGGIESTTIDLPDFNLVLAGDIHVRQDLGLTKTQGEYLGSAIQRTKADANVERGWTEFTISRMTPESSWKIEKRFQPIRNFFTREQFKVDASTEVEDLKIDPSRLNDQLVEVKLMGPKEYVDSLAEDPYWIKMSQENNCRKLEVIRSYAVKNMETTLENLEKCSTAEEILEMYLDSQFANIGGLSKDRLISVLSKIKGGL